MKNKSGRSPLIAANTFVFFTFIIMSCVSYKTIAPGSTDRLSGSSSSISPGNVIRVTVKKGEITDLKVTSIDEERIIGIQRYRDLNGLPQHLHKVIMVPAIQSIKKQRISPVKTVGLVIILVTSPLWIWALGGSPL